MGTFNRTGNGEKNMRIQLVIGSLIALVAVAPSRGEIPLGTAFTFHGQLKEGGVPLEDTADFEFTLWDDEGNGNPPVGGLQVGGVQAINALPVTAGLFSVTLNDGGEFGGDAFIGNARWLQIAVRSPAGGGVFTTLAPRQALTATPHALLALNALNAEQLGGIDAIEYVTTANAGNTFIENDTVQQPTANFNISGNGTVSSLNANGAVSLGGIAPPAAAPAGQGRVYFDSASNKVKISENNGAYVNLIGAGGVGGSGNIGSIPYWSGATTLSDSVITQNANGVQLPNGVQLAVGAQGNQMSFGSPNGETGLSIAGASGRADVRFDGTTLRLNVGPPGTPPSNGIAITSTAVKLPNGVQLAVGAQGNAVAFGSPNGETGMTIAGANGRADLRFDGSTLRIFNGPAGTPPANGIAINASGNVGIGTTTPNTRLSLSGGPSWTSNFWTASMNLQNASAIGWEANASGQLYGIGHTTGGLTFFRTPSVFGNNSAPANYDMIITDTGNITQPLANNGLVKAMAYVRVYRDCIGGVCSELVPSIVRCYNSTNNATSGNCGFSFPNVYSYGVEINFGFQVENRFISLTASDGAGTASVYNFPNANTVYVLNGNGNTTQFFIYIY